jgi:hypothetical protein
MNGGRSEAPGNRTTRTPARRPTKGRPEARMAYGRVAHQRRRDEDGYYLLDTTGFEPNVFTTTIVGINDGTAPTATGPNHDLPTIAAIRLVVEPKRGLPTDLNDPGAFINIFTDISGLFVINNESAP